MTNELGLAVSELGFVDWHWVRERASVSDIFQQPSRCGIYVLSFSDGEAYVGQAVDVTRRYVQHRKKYADIEKMTFKVVEREDLGVEETTAISKIRSAGVTLRNVIFTPMPCGVSDFNVIMPVDNQERWLADIDYVDLTGPRIDDPEMRHRFARKYEELLRLPWAKEAVTVLRAYVRLGLPAFLRSEMCFWACSCLPGHADSKGGTYSRISVYQQEVFAVGVEEGQLIFSWHLAKSPLQTRFGSCLSRVRYKFSSVEEFNHTYAPGGKDQIELRTRGAKAALSLLRDPDVIRSIRLFNLRLMQMGPCMFSRYHCFDLADNYCEVEADFRGHADAAHYLFDLADRINKQQSVSLLARARSLFGRR